MKTQNTPALPKLPKLTLSKSTVRTGIKAGGCSKNWTKHVNG